MKHKFLVRIFVILCALLLLAAAAAVGLYYYVFSIPEPNGLSLASWPNRFTDNFPGWIEAEGNTVRVADIGLERLDEYGLCLQILDASGREAFSYRKPASWPEASRTRSSSTSTCPAWSWRWTSSPTARTC